MHDAPRRRSYWQAALGGCVALQALAVACLYTSCSKVDRAAPTSSSVGRPGDLPAPSSVSVAAFEAKLFAFLNDRTYAKLGWATDKGVRDTGPFIAGKSYGTHPAVRVYYSPGVVRWLLAGRVGPIPDGEIIIKEQYAAPAVRHRDKSEAELWARSNRGRSWSRTRLARTTGGSGAIPSRGNASSITTAIRFHTPFPVLATIA